MSAPERTTRTGVPVRDLYEPEDIEDGRTALGKPGHPPYTRGIQSVPQADEPWIIAQYSGFGTPRETNARFRRLIESGQTGLSIALDLPTQVGLDSDATLASGQVGRVGVPIDTVDDLHTLFEGIDLRNLRQLRTTANSIAPIIVAMLLVYAEESGVSPDEFQVFLQNDVLKEYPARGTWIFPPPAGLSLSVDVLEYCTKHFPHWHPIQFSGAHFREAGATAAQEVAFAFANGLAYLDEARRRGIDISTLVRNIHLFVYLHTDVLEEVAKLRAARRVWHQLMTERFGLDATCSALRIFAWCGGSSLTAQEPYNNVVRVALQALAGALGGVQTMATASYDEAYSLPSEHAALVALRTQQIIAHESGVASTIDPLGGSYAAEGLTSELERLINRELDAIEQAGGAVVAIDNGYMKRSLDEASYTWHQRVSSGELVVVGVNKFRQPAEPFQPSGTDFTASEAEQLSTLASVRASRDWQRVQQTLDALANVLTHGKNPIDALIDCVRARATIGEIVDQMKEVLGTWQQQA